MNMFRFARRPLNVAVVAVCLAGAAGSGALAGNVVVTPAASGIVNSGPGPAPAGIVIGIAAALGLYDLMRRTTCSGDFLGFGGPGFSTPLRPTDNALPPPVCPPVGGPR